MARLKREELKAEDQEELESGPMTIRMNDPVDQTEASLGRIILHCIKCQNDLSLGRVLEATLCCMHCGSYDFISRSNFIMENSDQTRAVLKDEIINCSVNNLSERLWLIR
jgi:hypothetical protein